MNPICSGIVMNQLMVFVRKWSLEKDSGLKWIEIRLGNNYKNKNCRAPYKQLFGYLYAHSHIS